MNFNICYMGPEWLFHLRRDFILCLKYALEDLGHTANLSPAALDRNGINLVIGAYFLSKDNLQAIARSGYRYINVNTEVIDQDMLNYNPQKVDFLGAYLPFMEDALARWDVILDNIPQYEKYESPAHFLRWGYHPKLRDIEHRPDKDLDFYFFGMLSQRRKTILDSLTRAGFRGTADHSCPYFLRNDRIARAKVQLNLIQEDRYTHVNSFRICYLANNSCCILSENENDPADYLKLTKIITPKSLIESIKFALEKKNWQQQGEDALAAFKGEQMQTIMEKLLDTTPMQA